VNCPTVEIWFEFASTYSYPAVMRIEALATSRDVGVVWRPFLLGPIFAAQGWNDSPFNIYPAKGRYMWRDLERVCAKHGLAFRRPSVFPRGSLLGARVACLAAEESWCPAFVRAVYHANFVDDRDIAGPTVITDLLRALVSTPEQIVARATEPEAKDSLRRQTERAAALGIFGAPTVVVGDELFWGNERLEDALAWAAARSPTGRA
jgi:2-hydroxychromene-2-carboxylate isomerase